MRNKLFLKVAIIGLLTLLLLIPLAMVRGAILERGQYRDMAVGDIAMTWTGAQRLVGPVLSVPYQYTTTENRWNEKQGRYESVTHRHEATAVFMPVSLAVKANVETSTRQRGIYAVPVYTSRLDIGGTFDLDALDEFAAEHSGFVGWGTPAVNVALSDVRGIGASPSFVAGGEPLAVEPGTEFDGLPSGLHAELPPALGDGGLDFRLQLELRGSETLAFAPLAGQAEVSVDSAWPHPKFHGLFLPTDPVVSDDGFEADWRVSSFGTGAERQLEQCGRGNCAELGRSYFGVQFVDPTNLYAKVLRAAKYGVLFVVLTFTAFFLTETVTGRPLHPVQYTLVGGSLVIFYLLLMALAEHTGFGPAYVVATAACSLLLLIYLAGVFRSALQGAVYGAGLATLYSMLYAILRSEDFAMLMGTLLLFAVLAALMIATRRLDWYELGERLDAAYSPRGSAG